MDRRTFLLAPAFGLLARTAAAQYTTPPDTATRISQSDFKKLLAQKNVVVLDTRNEEVYKIGHIPGALLLPLEGLESFDEPQYTPLIDSLKKETKPIVAYCAWHNEATSARAVLLLQKRGVKNVKALLGGWNEWVNDNNPVNRGDKP